MTQKSISDLPPPLPLEEQTEGPGSAVVVAYLVMTFWGVLVGIGIGWLIWG